MRISFIVFLILAIVFTIVTVSFIANPYLRPCTKTCTNNSWKISSVVYEFDQEQGGREYFSSSQNNDEMEIRYESVVKVFPIDLVSLTLLAGLGAILTRPVRKNISNEDEPTKKRV